MRLLILSSIALVLAVGALVACNSNETAGSQSSSLSLQQQPQQPQQSQSQQNQPTPNDGARRITAEELHEIWEKGKVLVVDTRDEASYKTSHIKGAISIPANQVLPRIDEFPRDKMIVTYCT